MHVATPMPHPTQQRMTPTLREFRMRKITQSLLRSTNQMNVHIIQRKSITGHYSVEGYFAQVKQQLSAMGISTKTLIAPHESKGLLRRIQIANFARLNQGSITHIAGDIQFAAISTDPKTTIVTVLDCTRLHQLHGIRREALRQIWFKIPLEQAAAITVISEATKNDLLRWIPTIDPSKIHTIPVSISPNFHANPKPFPSANPRILQVGTKPNKNISRLIEALQGIDCNLAVIGKLDAQLLDKLNHANIKYKIMHNLSAHEIVQQYIQADIVSFASTIEGFGMPILEAQAIGRLVITSNCSSMPEVAGKGGAIFVDPFSVDSMREGFHSAILNASIRNKAIQIGYLNSQKYNIKQIANRYLHLYESVLSKAQCS